MLDRRQSARDRVLFGAVAKFKTPDTAVNCVVRNISDAGACVEFDSAAKLPDELSLSVPRKGRSFLATLIWRQAGRVGLAFRSMIAPDTPADDLDERLRKSEQKKRQLQRRINVLLGED